MSPVIETRAVLASCPPVRAFHAAEVARDMGQPQRKLSNHFAYMMQRGWLRRLSRGVYQLTELGRTERGVQFGDAAEDVAA